MSSVNVRLLVWTKNYSMTEDKLTEFLISLMHVFLNS